MWGRLRRSRPRRPAPGAGRPHWRPTRRSTSPLNDPRGRPGQRRRERVRALAGAPSPAAAGRPPLATLGAGAGRARAGATRTSRAGGEGGSEVRAGGRRSRRRRAPDPIPRALSLPPHTRTRPAQSKQTRNPSLSRAQSKQTRNPSLSLPHFSPSSLSPRSFVRSPASSAAPAASSIVSPTAPSDLNWEPTAPSARRGPPRALTLPPTAPSGSNWRPTAPSAVNACETVSVAAPTRVMVRGGGAFRASRQKPRAAAPAPPNPAPAPHRRPF